MSPGGAAAPQEGGGEAWPLHPMPGAPELGALAQAGVAAEAAAEAEAAAQNQNAAGQGQEHVPLQRLQSDEHPDAIDVVSTFEASGNIAETAV